MHVRFASLSSHIGLLSWEDSTRSSVCPSVCLNHTGSEQRKAALGQPPWRPGLLHSAAGCDQPVPPDPASSRHGPAGRRRIDGQADMDRQTDGLSDGRTDGQTDKSRSGLLRLAVLAGPHKGRCIPGPPFFGAD
jgi:hypothetical protein